MQAIGLYLTRDCNQRCSYCFKERQAEVLSMEDFQVFHDWFIEHRLESVILAGGEPTLHHQFAQIVRALKDRSDAHVQIITNLVCDTDKLEAFKDCDVLVNTSPPHSVADRVAFEKNLERLVAVPGTHVILSCTLWSLGQEDDHIVRYCRELGIHHVRLDFARASVQRRNSYVTLDQLGAFKEKLLLLGERLVRENVWLGIDCSLPAGTFTAEELSRIQLRGYSPMDPEQFVCHHMLYVNPDLTVSACPFHAIGPRRLDEYEDFGDLFATAAAAIRDRMKDGRPGPVLCMAERLLEDPT